ncbi:MAG: SpoIIE family protein phosphatase [Solirubrobacteraceae bacterium]
MDPRGPGLAVAPSYALVRILAEAGSVADAADQLGELIARHFDWELAGLWLPDDDGHLLRLAGGWVAPGDAPASDFLQLSRRLTFAEGVGLPGTVWQGGRPWWVTDISGALNFPRVEAALRAGLQTAVGVPIVEAERVLGVIEVLGREARATDEEQLGALTVMGRQIGQYVARLRAEDRLRASEEVSASIVEAALDCVITMNAEGRIVDFNPAAEATFGYAREDVAGELLADVIIPPELREAHRNALRRYLETRQPVILNRRLELTGMRADGTTLAVELTVTRLGEREPPVFAGFVRDIGDRVRNTEQVARLLELEQAARLRAEEAERFSRGVAETLQRGLLPTRLPSIPGLELGAAYRPGSADSLVGGDFYDVFELGERCWGIAVGDVCGKGAAAASITALMRWTIRAAAARGDGPAAVLETVNRTLMSDTAPGDYCTAIYATIDAGGPAPVLRLSVAGHPLPLLRSAAGAVEPVGTTGTLLGALDEPELFESRLELEPGALLLFYTDGVTECRTQDGLFGAERLRDWLRQSAPEGAQALADQLEADVVGDPSLRVTDDIALLAFRAHRARRDLGA